ncbi:MAG: PEGA domain-containing protein [Vicinamibacterales bacterium]
MTPPPWASWRCPCCAAACSAPTSSGGAGCAGVGRARAHGDEDHPLSSVLSRWLRRALQLDEGGFDSPHAAQIAFEEVLSSNRRYVTGTAALEEWVRACAPEPEPVPEPEPEPVAVAAAAVEGREDDAVPVAVETTTGRRVLGLRPLWAAVVLAVVLMQAGVIGWYWSRPKEGPAEGEGELVVSSRPVGARVLVDGSERGATPLTLTLSAGAHVVEVRAGTGEPRVIPMVIRANVQTVQYVELQEAIEAPPPAARPKRR